MAARVYLETSVVSYLAARPSRDIVVAGHQRTTHEWWRQRDRFDLVISQLVIDEAQVGSPELAQQRIALLKGLPLLNPSEASLEFAEHLVQARIIPRAAAEDAAHVALGTVHGVNYLVTWNLKHIANAFIRPRIEQASRQFGYVPTIICTPEELLDA